MFKNIGSKIKGLAKFLFWLMTIGCMIGAFFFIAAGFANDRNNSILYILIGIGIIILGIVLAWINNFLLYGFGELIDSNQKMLKLMEEKNKSQPNNNNTNVSINKSNDIESI